MAEHDLGRIVQQVQALRRVDASAQQTQTEYKSTVINHTQGLLAICNQPDVRNIVASPQNHITIDVSEHLVPMDPNLSFKLQHAGIDVDEMFAPRQGEPPRFKLQLQIVDTPQTGLFFALAAKAKPQEFGLGNFLNEQRLIDAGANPHPVLPGYIESREQQHVEYFFQTIAPEFESVGLQAANRWRVVRDQNGAIFFGFPLTPDDFVRHPEWLEAFDTAVMNRLVEAQSQKQVTAQVQQERIAQFQSAPLARVIAELQRNPRAYSPSQLHEVAQDAAETVVEDPTLRTAFAGVSEQRVVEIVGQMLEQRLAALQVAPDGRIVSTISPRDEERINQAARGDAATESMFRRFVRRSRDPERAVQALVELTALIPGAGQLQAILRVFNVYFGPEETTR